MVRPGFPPSPHTKDFWVPATGGTERVQIGRHTGFRIDADGEEAFIEFIAPRDFTSIVAAEVIAIVITYAADMVVNIETHISTNPGSYASYSDSTTHTQSNASNWLFPFSVADALDNLAAGRCVGIRLYRPTAGNTNLLILGFRLRYA